MPKRIFFIFSIIILLLNACEPFMLSTFPAFLTDLSALTDLSPYLIPGDIERYDFSVLNNGVFDYVFLLAHYYSGEKRLYIFNDNLALIDIITDSEFGSRRTIDINGLYLIGRQVFSLAPNYALQYTVSSTGPDGFAAVTRKGVSVYYNTLIESYGTTVDFRYHTTTWTPASPTPSPDYRMISGDSDYYRLIYCRWLVDSARGPTTVMIFQKENWPDSDGYAVVIDQSINFPDSPTAASSTPLLSGDPPCIVIPLGRIDSQAYVTYNGVLAQGRDGLLRLYDWNGTLKASTQAYDSSGRLHIDYGIGDYYYVFDPATLKLYKARNWWQK